MTRIHHVTLIVDDLEVSRDFYVNEFGFSEREVEGLDYPGAFLIINEEQQLHLAELPDVLPTFRGHFCLRVADFSTVFYRMKELGILDIRPWGRIRELPGGSMQLYIRDPAGNLVEITSEPEDREGIDERIFADAMYGGGPYRYHGG
ncbi:MAG: VOC family protein [Lewinella sp.]